MEWGFDLTDFGTAENFKKVLKENGLLSGYRKETKRWDADEYSYYDSFTWSNTQVKLITNNNPITGKYGSKGREPQKGYASYIGITGEPDAVKKLVMSIRKRAIGIKDESPNKRDFI